MFRSVLMLSVLIRGHIRFLYRAVLSLPEACMQENSEGILIVLNQ